MLAKIFKMLFNLLFGGIASFFRKGSIERKAEQLEEKKKEVEEKKGDLGARVLDFKKRVEEYKKSKK